MTNHDTIALNQRPAGGRARTALRPREAAISVAPDYLISLGYRTLAIFRPQC